MVARRQESHLAGRVGTLGGTTKEHHKPTHHLHEQPEATHKAPSASTRRADRAAKKTNAVQAPALKAHRRPYSRMAASQATVGPMGFIEIGNDGSPCAPSYAAAAGDTMLMVDDLIVVHA